MELNHDDLLRNESLMKTGGDSVLEIRKGITMLYIGNPGAYLLVFSERGSA